jgi:hypothetical protein
VQFRKSFEIVVLQGHPGGSVLADLVCNLVKAPIGWVLSLMVRELAASMGRKKRLLRLRWSRLPLLLEMAMAFKISVPSDASLRATEKVGPWPKEWSAFLK